MTIKDESAPRKDRTMDSEKVPGHVGCTCPLCCPEKWAMNAAAGATQPVGEPIHTLKHADGSSVTVQEVEPGMLALRAGAQRQKESAMSDPQPPTPSEPTTRAQQAETCRVVARALRVESTLPHFSLELRRLYAAEADAVEAGAAALRSSSGVVEELERTWQPIETAPKDGTSVLLFWSAEHGSEYVEYFACGAYGRFRDGSGGWGGESFLSRPEGYWTRLLGERPTHWLPLPSPPLAVLRAQQEQE